MWLRSIVLLALLSAAGCAGRPATTASTSQTAPATPDAARFIRKIPWAGKGTWVKADTHVHTKFSDGSHTADEVVAKASAYGCQVIAITDHADNNLRAGTPEYADATRALRAAYPKMVLLAGLEWNVPPFGGDEHATVLVPPGPNEWATLAEFKARFDDYHRPAHNAELADEGLKWLAEHGPHDRVAPVVIYNHPSRKNEHPIQNLERWRSVNDLVIGFEGGPGHQGARPLGSYKRTPLVDRWDPAAARVGDTWDKLLQKGMDIWAACATSDFHNVSPGDLNDRWPGQFSETWLYVPELSANGVLQAFRAGSFFGVHGQIARSINFYIDAKGLARPAVAGEVIEVSAPCTVNAKLTMQVPETDWEGQPNRIDAIELIAISDEGASIVANRPPSETGDAFDEVVNVPRGGLVLRARGRRNTPGGSSLMFYTNPIRIKVR